MTPLIKQNKNDQLIIQITDTHLMDHPDTPFVQINPEQSFHAVINDILNRYQDIDAIIHTGDLAQVPHEATYQRYLSFMKNLNIPFYQIPGNHDDAEYFPFAAPDPIPAVLTFGTWKIVLLNSAVPHKVDGWIKAEQLNHLSMILQETQHHPVILACHHHPLEMKSKWIDRHILKNSDQLTQIMAEYQHIQAVIFGHVHQDSLNVWKNIQFLSTPSTSVQFKPKTEDFAFDDLAPGYRSLLLKTDGSFETRVHRLQNFAQNINKEISGY
ncbi:3',5'-cyclic-AMP phosphodiesterase [Acinetobacter sp. DSM 11652]|uniref:3',5'-cyclic-AMP phosphodiesterase n=1 Tax=Acinetobacter sp. DSM 11652 TaxID=346222 RepID=UPI0008B121FA|nr:3',5'-cyclic-AMP phosphodiesterase [Acinetobacter sp. DSM 11652]SEL95747.1 Icc protein [Acinetobacter sp. DSM 11652]